MQMNSHSVTKVAAPSPPPGRSPQPTARTARVAWWNACFVAALGSGQPPGPSRHGRGGGGGQPAASAAQCGPGEETAGLCPRKAAWVPPASHGIGAHRSRGRRQLASASRHTAPVEGAVLWFPPAPVEAAGSLCTPYYALAIVYIYFYRFQRGNFGVHTHPVHSSTLSREEG